MPVQFVIGRAGTGKTAHCLRAIRQLSAADPLGPPLLLITPDQATFSAERQLLTSNDVTPTFLSASPATTSFPKGTFRAQVLSFRRLAMLIARDLAPQALTPESPAAARAFPKPMDDIARTVLLEETVQRQKSNLRVFAAVASRPGFIQHLDKTLRELRQHGHTGTTLRALIAAAPPTPPLDPSTQDKLKDLALLLDDWSHTLDSTNAWDLEHFMHHAALNAQRSPLITSLEGQAQIWVDAFSAFSALEIRMLVALAQHAQQLTITLLADPDAPAIQEMRETRRPSGADALVGSSMQDAPESFSLFSRTERLHRRLIDAFRQHHIRIDATIPLRIGHRFINPEIQKVEAELFSDSPIASPVIPPKSPALPPPPIAPAPAKKSTRHVPAQPSLFDLFESPPAPGSAGGASAPDAIQPANEPPSKPASDTHHSAPGVELWESSDPETEVRIAAQAIRDLVLARSTPDRPPLRYRHIGLIVPDLESYQDALRRVFTEHHIPHFIDQRRTIAHHPLIELLRSAVALAQNHFDRDDLLLFLKTQLAGIPEADVSLLENYLIEHGINHNDLSTPFTWLAPNQHEDDDPEGTKTPENLRHRLRRANEIREKIHASLQTFIAELTATKAENVPVTQPQLPITNYQLPTPPASHFPRALRQLLTTLAIETQLTTWSTSATNAGSPELAQTHQQLWREVDQLLALLETILDTRQRTLEEFSQLFSTALENLSLGLIPPTVDQVLISSVTRSRVPELEVVIILGTVEGQFPKVLPEDPILSDAQREAFNARTADPIDDGADRQLLEMPFFDYVALTRARQKLILSFPLADRHGKALGSSRYIQRLRELLQTNITERTFDASSRTAIDRIATPDDLLSAVTTWARKTLGGTGSCTHVPVPHVQVINQSDEQLLPTLYNHIIQSPDPTLQSALALVWPAIAGIPSPHLSQDLAERFYPPSRPLRMSVTQLEKFAACPLQYFLHYTLGLRQREELQLDQLDMGILYHRILERVYTRIIDKSLKWPDCEASTLRTALEKEVDNATQELHAELAQQTPGYEKMRARLKRTLAILLEADRHRACHGSLRPTAVELTFGNPMTRPNASPRNADIPDGFSEFESPPSRKPAPARVSLPMLPIQTPLRRTVQVNGKIDRMDSAGNMVSVIDYKSSNTRTMQLYKLFHGISLQLPVYALVTRTLAKKHPVAALYIALGLARKRVNSPKDALAPDTVEFYHQFKPRGIVDAAAAGTLDAALDSDSSGRTGSGISDWFNLKFNKGDHAPTKGTDLFSHADFQLILDYTHWKIASLADDLTQGKIAPVPYRSRNEAPCDYCDFASLCPFDRVNGTYRNIPPAKPAEALAQMRAALKH